MSFKLSALRTVMINFMLVYLLFANSSPVYAQPYDLLLKDGHVIDPKNGIDSPMDVAISDDEIARVARVIQCEDLGHLSEGAVADVVVFNVREGNFGFIDGRRNLKTGERKLETELTIRAGTILWDLNGIASPLWDE